MKILKLILKIIATLLMLAAMFWAILPFGMGVYTFGSYVTLGVFGVILAVWYIPGLKKFLISRKPLKICYRIASVMLAAGLIYSAVVGTLILKEMINTDAEGDATVVVLGCMLHGETPSLMLVARLNAAYTYLENNPEADCVVSGGQGPDETIPEAVAMKKFLVDKGISENRIFTESESTTTIENLSNSKDVIEENGLAKKMVVVSDGFHLFRSRLIAKELGIESYSCPANTPWHLFECHFVREIFAVTKYLILG